jgi:hypothetical protein
LLFLCRSTKYLSLRKERERDGHDGGTLCPLARLDATKNTNDVCRMMCTPFFFLALLTSSLCTESPTHTYSGSYVSNTKGSALRDAGCVVRVGQGVLSGASLTSTLASTFEQQSSYHYDTDANTSNCESTYRSPWRGERTSPSGTPACYTCSFSSQPQVMSKLPRGKQQPTQAHNFARSSQNRRQQATRHTPITYRPETRLLACTTAVLRNRRGTRGHRW